MPTPLSPSLALLPAQERPVLGSGQERGHPWSRASSCGLGKARVWPWAPRPGVPGSCLEHPSVCSGAAVPTPQLFWGLGGAPALHSSWGTGPPGMPTRPGEPQPGRSAHLRPLGGLRGSSLPCLSVLLSGAWGADSRGEWGPRRPGLGGGVGRGQEAVLESSVFWGTASDRRPLSPQAIHRARPVPLTTGHGPGKQVAGRQAWLPSVIAEGRVWRLTDGETEAGPIRPPQPRTVPFVPGFGCVLIVLWLGPGRTIG